MRTQEFYEYRPYLRKRSSSLEFRDTEVDAVDSINLSDYAESLVVSRKTRGDVPVYVYSPLEKLDITHSPQRKVTHVWTDGYITGIDFDARDDDGLPVDSSIRNLSRDRLSMVYSPQYLAWSVDEPFGVRIGGRRQQVRDLLSTPFPIDQIRGATDRVKGIKFISNHHAPLLG